MRTQNKEYSREKASRQFGTKPLCACVVAEYGLGCAGYINRLEVRRRKPLRKPEVLFKIENSQV
jgi:hypothetical protein